MATIGVVHHSAFFFSSQLSHGYLERLACGLPDLISHLDCERETSGCCRSSAYDSRTAVERQSRRETAAYKRPCVRNRASRRNYLLAVRDAPGSAQKG